MFLITGVVLIGASVLLCALVYMGVNRPRPSWLVNDFLVPNVWTVLAVGLLMFGIGYLGQALFGSESRPASSREVAVAVATAAGFVVTLMVLAPRRRVTAWRRANPAVALTVIDGAGGAKPPDCDDHPDLPRAA